MIESRRDSGSADARLGQIDDVLGDVAGLVHVKSKNVNTNWLQQCFCCHKRRFTA
jgi:hypothetical protein